jgi:hypothetical protein
VHLAGTQGELHQRQKEETHRYPLLVPLHSVSPFIHTRECQIHSVLPGHESRGNPWLHV